MKTFLRYWPEAFALALPVFTFLFLTLTTVGG